MSQPIIVHFPSLVPEALAPGGARFLLLEPGLRRAADPSVYLVPGNLPMDRRQARAWLAQSMEFANRFQHRGDLSGVFATGQDDFYSGSSQDIQSQLRSMEGAPVAEDPEDLARRRAQMVLLLAVGLEERLAEIQALNRRLGDSWQGMAESLGLEEDDAGRLPHVLAVSPAATPDSAEPLPLGWLDEYGLSWPMLLECVFCFLPPDALLLVGDSSLFRAWVDMGLEFSPPAEPPAGLEPGALMGRAPGHVWSGRGSVPGDRPWLASERVVIFVPAGDGQEESA